MMEWLEILNNFTEQEKSQFTDCVNTLLAQSVLVAKKESDKIHYRFYEKYEDVLDGYFSLAGWKLKSTDNRVVVLRNNTGKNKVNLTLFESTLLFVIYKLYVEQLTDLRIGKGVHISNLEIREQFFILNIYNKLPARDKMISALKKFQRHSIMELIQGNWDDEDAVFVIYDSISEIITTSILKEMNKWIDELNKTEEWIYDEVN